MKEELEGRRGRGRPTAEYTVIDQRMNQEKQPRHLFHAATKKRTRDTAAPAADVYTDLPE